MAPSAVAASPVVDDLGRLMMVAEADAACWSPESAVGVVVEAAASVLLAATTGAALVVEAAAAAAAGFCAVSEAVVSAMDEVEAEADRDDDNDAVSPAGRICEAVGFDETGLSLVELAVANGVWTAAPAPAGRGEELTSVRRFPSATPPCSC